jgi:hypothetical protein
MNPVVQQGLWIVSGLLLFFVAQVQFNRPPTNRSGTTFLLFTFGLFFYYSLLIGIWLLVILLLRGGGIGLEQIGPFIGSALKTSDSLAGLAPIISVLIIIAAGQFKFVRRIETAARQFSFALAAIPREADQLAMELAHSANFHLKNEKLLSIVSKEIIENVGRNGLTLESEGSASSRFTRAVSLYWLFVAPHNNGTALCFPANAISRSTYARTMRNNNKLVAQATSLYGTAMEIGVAYFTSSKPTRQMEDALRRSVSELSVVVCSLIARYVLVQDLTAINRQKRLSSMGFKAYEHLPGFGRDQWVASMLGIVLLLAAMSAIFPSRQSFGQSLMYILMMAIQLGMALAGGTLVAQRFIRRDEGNGLRFPPVAELITAALMVIGLCVILRISFPLVPSLLNSGTFDWNESLEQFRIRWPFMLLPFVCTLSIGLLCSYLSPRALSLVRLALLGGLLNGMAFAFTGIVTGHLLSDDFLIANFRDRPFQPKVLIVATMGVVGAALGAMVLAMFSRSMRLAQLDADLRSKLGPVDPTFANGLSHDGASLDLDLRAVPVAPIDLGGYSRRNMGDLEGRYVCFRPTFGNPVIINAYVLIVRWDEGRCCLVFEEQGRADEIHSQKGYVYIPDGKPFLSLVTIDRGAIRVIMIARPDEFGIGLGLIMTLSNPGGTHFVPASSPIVLRRLKEHTPQLGFVRPGAPDYEIYLGQLKRVGPHFGILSALPFKPAEATVESSGILRLTVIEGSAKA